MAAPARALVGHLGIAAPEDAAHQPIEQGCGLRFRGTSSSTRYALSAFTPFDRGPPRGYHHGAAGGIWNPMSFNTFGHLFRVTTFGESHGPAIGCVVDGCPPGIPLTEADIQPYLDKRRPGQSRFTTQRAEPDQVRILSGVFKDERTGAQVTTGTPIGLLIDNVDQRSKDYSDIRDKYRPGHADYTYDVKYGAARLSRRRPPVGARDRDAGRRRRDRAQDRARHDGARRAGPDGHRTRSTARAGTGTRSSAIRSSARTRRRRSSSRAISTASARRARRSAR